MTQEFYQTLVHLDGWLLYRYLKESQETNLLNHGETQQRFGTTILFIVDDHLLKFNEFNVYLLINDPRMTPHLKARILNRLFYPTYANYQSVTFLIKHLLNDHQVDPAACIDKTEIWHLGCSITADYYLSKLFFTYIFPHLQYEGCIKYFIHSLFYDHHTLPRLWDHFKLILDNVPTWCIADHTQRPCKPHCNSNYCEACRRRAFSLCITPVKGRRKGCPICPRDIIRYNNLYKKANKSRMIKILLRYKGAHKCLRKWNQVNVKQVLDERMSYAIAKVMVFQYILPKEITENVVDYLWYPTTH
jgi:hypothetical protein